MKNFWRSVYALFKQTTLSVMALCLVALIVAWFLAARIFITIDPGHAGVLWSRFFGGTKVDRIYGEGMHYIFPWDRMYIYPMRIQQTAHEFDVLTVNGLTLHLVISIRYYPEIEMLGILHQRVGPNFVNTVVIPEIEAVLRILIGRLRAEEVYSTERSIIEKAVNSAIEQIAQRYIIVDDVIIKRIIFPASIADAIEKKMEQQQLAEAYNFRLIREEKEAARKQIEAEGFKQYNTILAASLSSQLLQWRSIQATLDLALSNNSKVVIIGNQPGQFQLFGDVSLDGGDSSKPPSSITPVPVEPGASNPQPLPTKTPSGLPEARFMPSGAPYLGTPTP